jgi:hypothetical protein
MNPSLLGAAAAAVLVAFWLVTRRQPRPLLRSDDTSAVAALNRAQRELVSRAPATPAPPAPAPGGPGPVGRSAEVRATGEPIVSVPLPLPADRRGRSRLLTRLAAAARGSLPERIEAMRTAHRWGHPAALPLLRRGLRDVHPAVVREAARGLEAYRGRPVAAASPPRGARIRP